MLKNRKKLKKNLNLKLTNTANGWNFQASIFEPGYWRPTYIGTQVSKI